VCGYAIKADGDRVARDLHEKHGVHVTSAAVRAGRPGRAPETVFVADSEPRCSSNHTEAGLQPETSKVRLR
jgi:hypothetical protein